MASALSFLNKYPYMRPADILLASLGTLAVLAGLIADNFGAVPRWCARPCLILIGLSAIASVIWHRL